MDWVLLSATMQAKEIAGVGEKVGLSFIESGIIGTVAILAIIIAILAIWKLLKVQDKISEVQNLRVDDLQKMNVRMEGLIEKLITTFSKMENALTNLTQTEKDGQALLQAMKQSQETVILEAVRGASRIPVGGKR